MDDSRLETPEGELRYVNVLARFLVTAKGRLRAGQLMDDRGVLVARFSSLQGFTTAVRQWLRDEAQDEAPQPPPHNR